MSDLTDALWATLDVLDELGIPYVIMGGLAVRFYGVPRPTYDVDFTISMARDELPRLYSSVARAGFTVPDQYRQGWVDTINELPLLKFRLYVRSGSFDIDVFLAETAFQKSVMQRRINGSIDDRPVWIVTPEDLILLKLIANRSRDYVDIADIRFMQGQLDEAYLRTWAAQLNVVDRLEQVLAEPAL